MRQAKFHFPAPIFYTFDQNLNIYLRGKGFFQASEDSQ